jgi:transposase
MLDFGIDWSEDHHTLCIRHAAGAAISRVALEHSLTGFDRIEVERRKLKVPASDCLVAIETSDNLVVDFLLEPDYPVYLVPPQATEGYRQRQRRSGTHDDDSDAALLADILRTDRESHRRLRPNTALTQHILAQVRLIEILRRSIQRQSNQLRAVLRRSYAPAVLAKFGDHRDRFPAAANVPALAGTCPVTQPSGKRKRVKFRRGCHKEFRRSAQQVARASLAQSGRVSAYWQDIRPHCDSDSHASRIRANRWLATIWKLWQTHQPYDEAYHVQQRARRRTLKSVRV